MYPMGDADGDRRPDDRPPLRPYFIFKSGAPPDSRDGAAEKAR